MAELVEAAEATHLANLAVADVEAAFLEGECAAAGVVVVCVCGLYVCVGMWVYLGLGCVVEC